jgi:hypothetical protein
LVTARFLAEDLGSGWRGAPHGDLEADVEVVIEEELSNGATGSGDPLGSSVATTSLALSPLAITDIPKATSTSVPAAITSLNPLTIVDAPKSKARPIVAPPKAAFVAPTDKAPVPKGPKVAASIPKPVVHPLAAKALGKGSIVPTARSSSLPKAPITPPKGPVTPPKGGAVPGSPPKAKAKLTLSAAVHDLSRVDTSVSLPKAIVPVDNRGVRICLDYNGTSNVDYPGGPQLDHFSLDATSSILDCLRSTERRKALKVQVCYLNRWLELRGIPSSQFVALNITTSRTKEELSADICQSHMDDKWGTYLACESKGVDVYLFSNRSWPRTQCVRSVELYFESVCARTTPKIFHRPFFSVPTADTVGLADR